jgi:signal transduction histidine kinase
MEPAARILIIDDEPSIREFLGAALGDRGYVVATAEDGHAAVEKVRGGRYDVALCDLLMPGIDGLQTIERIREIQPDLQVIVMTAHGTLESAIASIRQGVFDFLQKPLELEEVLFSIGKALEQREILERLGLFELSRTIFSTLEPDELYGRVVRSAVQVLRADDASLMLLDENGSLFIAISTSLQQEVLAATHLAIGERIAGRVAQQPDPLVINGDVAADERFRGVTSLRRINASIVCPLTMRGRLLGVLNVNRVVVPEKFTERDRKNAMILASLVALALGNARLHTELQARLRQLSDTQEEVIQSEKMTALGNLLSGVAHELNNPLCGILGYAQLLQQANLEGKVRKGVEIILKETERASRIVGNLLRFARREKPEKKPLGINGVLLKTLERKDSDLKACRIDIRVDLDPKLPYILGDFHQLMVAFHNLITNAQQAMFESRGQGALTIRSAARERVAVVTFTDDGPGIPAEHVRRVFDPFFTTKDVGKGTGLGLSVCFAIVRDHGGAIRVASEPGRGATFTLELPIASPEALAAAGPPAAAAAPAPCGPRVLVADPEPRIQDLLVDLLEKMGLGADTAGSGEGALAKIRGGEYAALIADYSMPRLDGRALLDALRAEKPSLVRRVLFLTSDIADPGVMAFAAASGTLVVGKPFPLETVRAAVRRMLNMPPIVEAPVH